MRFMMCFWAVTERLGGYCAIFNTSRPSEDSREPGDVRFVAQSLQLAVKPKFTCYGKRLVSGLQLVYYLMKDIFPIE